MVSPIITEKFPWRNKQFWEQQIGTKWTNVLTPLLRSEYVHELMIKLRDAYDQKEPEIFPKKLDLFKAFRLTPFEDVKVIIIGQDPYHNGRATGLAFANPIEFHNKPSPALRRILKELPSLGSDCTLESWTKQGVLLLNTALTVERKNPGCHASIWSPFTAEVLRLMSENHSGLIFLLWGKHAQGLKKHINENLHYIIESEHPTAGVYSGNPQWDCNDCFIKTNTLLLGNNGVDAMIQW